MRLVRAGDKDRSDIMSGGKSIQKKPAAFVHLRVPPDYPKEEQDKLTLLHFLKNMGCNGLLAAPWGVFDHPNWRRSSSANRIQGLKAVSGPTRGTGSGTFGSPPTKGT